MVFQHYRLLLEGKHRCRLLEDRSTPRQQVNSSPTVRVLTHRCPLVDIHSSISTHRDPLIDNQHTTHQHPLIDIHSSTSIHRRYPLIDIHSSRFTHRYPLIDNHHINHRHQLIAKRTSRHTNTHADTSPYIRANNTSAIRMQPGKNVYREKPQLEQPHTHRGPSVFAKRPK